MNFRDILLRIISFGLLSEAKENSYIHYKFISNQENLQSILNNNKALIAISGHPSKPALIDEYDFSNLPELEPKIVENDETYILSRSGAKIEGLEYIETWVSEKMVDEYLNLGYSLCRDCQPRMSYAIPSWVPQDPNEEVLLLLDDYTRYWIL